MAWWQQPFFQVALPIIMAFALATLFQTKRIDDQGKRLDDLRDAVNRGFAAIDARLGRIEVLLGDHAGRIATLEERTSPLRR
jgi:glutathione S-transferase